MALKENCDEKFQRNEIKEENQKSEENEDPRKLSRAHTTHGSCNNNILNILLELIIRPVFSFRRKESRWATVLKLIAKRKAEIGKTSQVEYIFQPFFNLA